MSRTQVDLNKEYLPVDYLEREEEGYSLVFINETEECYKTNKTATTILGLLGKGAMVEEICLHLADKYGVPVGSIRMDVVEYISQLLSSGIIREVHKEKGPSEYAPPSMIPLEEAFEKGKQCRIFGMP
jgi:hypothetical protein